MKSIKVSIKSTAPMLFHNGQLRDPLNMYGKKMKEITKKRLKTEQDYIDLANLEWEGGLYLNENREIIIPALNIEACIRAGAKKSKLGKSVQAGLMVKDDVLFQYEGSKNIDDLKEDKNYRLTVGAKIQQSAVMRTRPMFSKWNLDFEILFDERVMNKDDIKKSIEDAGLYSGLGDWLPRFGRFEIEKFN